MSEEGIESQKQKSGDREKNRKMVNAFVFNYLF